MLEDVRQVRAFTHSLDETTWLSAGAAMRLERRDRCQQTIDESVDVRGSDLFQGAKANVGSDYWCEAPVIRASEGPDSRDFQVGGVVSGRRVGRW